MHTTLDTFATLTLQGQLRSINIQSGIKFPTSKLIQRVATFIGNTKTDFGHVTYRPSSHRVTCLLPGEPCVL